MNILAPKTPGSTPHIHAIGEDGRTKCKHAINPDTWKETEELVNCVSCNGARKGWMAKRKKARKNGRTYSK